MKKIIIFLFLISIFSCKNKYDDETLLFKYVESNDIKNLKKLIIKRVNLNYKKKGISPLTVAAIKGHFKIVKLLVENGANLNPTKDSRVPLEGACMSHNTEIVKYLINKGANINYKDKHGRSILMKAATEGDPTIIKILLQNGARVNDKDKNNTSALFYVAMGIGYFDPKDQLNINNYLKTAKILIDAGADVNNFTNYGEITLALACNYHQIELVKILLDAGADVNIRFSKCKVPTPLDVAINSGFTEGEKLLRQHGAKTAAELDKENTNTRENTQL